MSVPPIRTRRFELVSMSPRFMRLLVDHDLAGAEAEIGATVPAGLPDELDDYLRDRIADPPLEADAMAWLGRVTILTDPDGARRVIGSCGFHAPPGPDGRVEVGCTVEPTYRRQGVGTEVLRGLFDWARARGVDRFRASILPDNVGSIAMVERLGFRQVGVEIDDVDGEVLILELEGWSPGVPPIRTPRYELVSMSMAFMRALVARDLPAAEAEIGAIVPAHFPDTLDNFLQFRIADLGADPAAQPWLGRAIVLTEGDGTRRIIGSVGFHAPPGPDGRVEIGYRVEPAYRRQGVASEVARTMFEWAHDQGVDRFRAAVAPDNVASLAVIARFGFRQVGVQIDDIDGKELVFELDGWPPAP
jgi:RimJ/RimL family protein N-acetyltransferase